LGTERDDDQTARFEPAPSIRKMVVENGFC
jgi:hypothetical protein